MAKNNCGKKMNVKMFCKAEQRAEKRFNGALNILALIGRGAPIHTGPRAVMALSNKYGV